MEMLHVWQQNTNLIPNDVLYFDSSKIASTIQHEQSVKYTK
jgi:hypothetical protein